MAYTFEQILAVDPSNPANVARAASITIFAPGDAAKTPLTLTDTNGSPLPNPLTVNANGFGPAFMHATLDRVAWEGGGFTGFLTSYEGMKEEATAARTAAESAAATAGAEAAAVADAAVATIVSDAEAAAEAASQASSAAAASATAAANAAALVGAPADDAIAAAVGGTGATKTALNAAIAAATSTKLDTTTAAATYARPEANTVIYLGDSLTGNGWSSYNNSSPVFPVRGFAGRGYWTWAQIRSGHRLKLVGLAGVGGDTINMMLARLNADVLSKKPSIVVVEAGRNDISAGDTAATLTTELFSMWDQILANGARVIATTITPRDGDTSTQIYRVAEANKMIRERAQVTPGVTLADTASVMVDRVTGLCKAGYFYDGLHPNSKGAASMGRVVAEAIEKIAPPLDNFPVHVADATTLFATNALMLFTGGTLGAGITGNVAQTWKVALRSTGTVTAVASKVARTDNKPGEWQQVTISNLADNGLVQVEPPAATIGSQLATGDKAIASIEFQTDEGFNPTERFDLVFEARNSSGVTVAQTNALALVVGDDMAGDAYGRIPNGVLQTPALTIPAGAVTLVVQIQVRGTGNVGTFRLGRLYVRKDNAAAV